MRSAQGRTRPSAERSQERSRGRFRRSSAAPAPRCALVDRGPRGPNRDKPPPEMRHVGLEGDDCPISSPQFPRREGDLGWGDAPRRGRGPRCAPHGLPITLSRRRSQKSVSSSQKSRFAPGGRPTALQKMAARTPAGAERPKFILPERACAGSASDRVPRRPSGGE